MQTYKPEEIAKLLRCCRATVMRRIRDGEIRTVQVGGVRRIPHDVMVQLTTVGAVSEEARRIYFS
jgi:excisionase family DNA binding protein